MSDPRTPHEQRADLPRCLTCRYWQPTPGDPSPNRGQCVRWAPSAGVAQDGTVDTSRVLLATWPTTASTDRCGEHAEVIGLGFA